MFDKQIDIFFIGLFIVVIIAVIIQILFKPINNLILNKTTKEEPDKKEDRIERFIVADAEDFHNYQKWRKMTMKDADNFAKSDLETPPPDKIVNYDKEIDRDKDFAMMVVHGKPSVEREKDDKAFTTYHDFGWEGPKQHVACANASVSQQYNFGDKSLLPFKISCQEPNKLTAENYYKTHYRPQVIPIEDYYIRGANYLDYTSFMSPYQARGYRILSQNTKGLPPDQTKTANLPVGYNYAFHNTPAMPMP